MTETNKPIEAFHLGKWVPATYVDHDKVVVVIRIEGTLYAIAHEHVRNVAEKLDEIDKALKIVLTAIESGKLNVLQLMDKIEELPEFKLLMGFIKK
jgi:hypothetical protein